MVATKDALGGKAEVTLDTRTFLREIRAMIHYNFIISQVSYDRILQGRRFEALQIFKETVIFKALLENKKKTLFTTRVGLLVLALDYY